MIPIITHTQCHICHLYHLLHQIWSSANRVHYSRECSGSCITIVTWRCRKNFRQWERTLRWEARCHYLKFLRQRPITVVIQDPVHGCLDWRLNKSFSHVLYYPMVQQCVLLDAVIALAPVSIVLLHQIISLQDINVPVGDNSYHKDFISPELIQSTCPFHQVLTHCFM